MTKFTHAGVEITLGDNGKFTATVQGNKVTKPSLDAMKKHIDTKAKSAFKSLPVLVHQNYSIRKNVVKGTDYCRTMLLSPPVETKRKYGRRELKCKVQGDYNVFEVESLYTDTPETIAAIKALDAFEERKKKIKEQLEAEEEKLQEALAKFKIGVES
jgi:hypothetical protein